MQACHERASAYNLQFSAPLDENEVRAISKSIAKWTHCNFSSECFHKYIDRTHSPEIQSARGKKSRGGGRKKGSVNNSSNEQIKPWNLLGISRATFYRKKRNVL
ncbi:primase C-terminal domain-containing protein [Salmonella enterica]|uniref:primase C-terminal domain-containing protein n=1 Tax=Salmonella enterica TaxID=28901 RepID=UPI003463427A